MCVFFIFLDKKLCIVNAELTGKSILFVVVAVFYVVVVSVCVYNDVILSRILNKLSIKSLIIVTI